MPLLSICFLGVSMAEPESKCDIYHVCEDEDVYHTVEQDSFPSELVNRPPVPVPRPHPAKPQDKESYIYKGDQLPKNHQAGIDKSKTEGLGGISCLPVLGS